MKKKLLAASLALTFGAGAGYVVNAYAQQSPRSWSSSARQR